MASLRMPEAKRYCGRGNPLDPHGGEVHLQPRHGRHGRHRRRNYGHGRYERQLRVRQTFRHGQGPAAVASIQRSKSATRQAAGGTAPPSTEREGQVRDASDDLIDVIKANVAPTSWDDVGGPGSIAYYNERLIVSQSEAVHKGLKELLPKLLGAPVCQP